MIFSIFCMFPLFSFFKTFFLIILWPLNSKNNKIFLCRCVFMSDHPSPQFRYLGFWTFLSCNLFNPLTAPVTAISLSSAAHSSQSQTPLFPSQLLSGLPDHVTPGYVMLRRMQQHLYAYGFAAPRVHEAANLHAWTREHFVRESVCSHCCVW